jgi:hypothetical protein
MNLWEVIKDLSYKPGWKYTLNYRSTGRHSLWVTAKVQHSTTLEWVTFDFERLIPATVQNDLAGFLTWVEDITLEAEFHELREFLRYKGELVNDPHATTPVDYTVPPRRFIGVSVPDSPGHGFEGKTTAVPTHTEHVEYFKADMRCNECQGPVEFVRSNGIASYYRCVDPSKHGDQDALYIAPVEQW